MRIGNYILLLYSTFVVVFLSACEPVKQVESNLPASIVQDPRDAEYQQYLQDLSSKHLLPAYLNLSEKSKELTAEINQACRPPHSWNNAKQAWREVMQAWQAVKWMQLGPVNQQSRHQRMQYWPDGNDAVGRGLQKLLLQQTTPDITRLAQINVGAQGLPALELLLFSEQVGDGVELTHLCAVAQVIAQNVELMTARIYQQWLTTEFRDNLIAGTGEFSGRKDAVEELVSNWLAQLIILVDNRLTYPLSVSSPGIPLLAESPFADASMQNIRTNLHAYKLIFTAAGGYGLDDILAKQGQGDLANQVLTELDKSIQLASQLPNSFSLAMQDEQQWQKMKQLIAQIKELQKLLAEGVLMQLKLNIGFNALDGD